VEPTYLDLRDELERTLEPLLLYLSGEVWPWTLEQIEKGEVPAPTRAYILVCPYGEQSKLGAYFLQADGLNATSLEGGVLRLRREKEKVYRLEQAELPTILERKLLDSRLVRQFKFSENLLEVWGMISEEELVNLLELS
jgi:rhodanese-related sulfurtransferase